MNRIILAYAPENAALADSIDRKLSRIGIPFEHANGDVATQIASADEPVLLLVTDNFLISHACMLGLLPVLQKLATENRLVAVLADGIDAAGQAIPTQIDRMSNVLHYMKYWQDVWLALSDRHQHLEGEEKAGLTAHLDATRGIANAVGDILSTLRDAGYMSWQKFEDNDFEAFFQKFNLGDWHGQYKRLVVQDAEIQSIAEPQLPEVTLSGGLLTPEPMPEIVPPIPPPVPEIINPAPEAVDVLETAVSETELHTAAHHLPEENKDTSVEEQQAARDAWFWIEKGHAQRGLELFQMALEHYPDSEWLKSEYEKAAELANPPLAEPVPIQELNPTSVDQAHTSDEAKSYDLMGEMAAERGDYLFAKYCWDRVMEIDPAFPEIYRKLGLMTAEHLRDYRETAVIYLRKALEINPDDAEVKTALGEEMAEAAAQSAASVEIISAPLYEVSNSTQEALSAPDPAPTNPPPASKLVLITGATSGIGRATAEIFARNGYRLILTGRRVERLVEVKNHLEAEFGAEILILPFDVRDPGAVEAALGNLPESFQNIDILVNNAGLAKGLAPIHEGSLEHWETMIDTNVKGLLYVTRLVSPGMVRRRSGHIINVCSSAGRETYPNGNVYCATKFAVDALSKSMRLDLHAHNIRVSQVSPGHVEETEFAITRFDGDAERAKIYNDFQPLKSSDVADAIFYMATRPPHVNIQDLQMFATQQASSTVIDRSGR